MLDQSGRTSSYRTNEFKAVVVLWDIFTFRLRNCLRKLARKLFRDYLGYHLSQLLFGTRPGVVVFLAEAEPHGHTER